ncbi:hypothetical protein SAMN02800692_1502 [Luteibacter sp. UNC138MFCol5.1]|uniref:hypothetical protein n=1 Tax=Luteibacter sp. UNC138MFCol5.1 TaxID=1502774 RepID=UPI0008D6574F|nr:hypothetical protein [Luteibacter sp. UNC138MFCol5.1]SEO63162.1 hypothetical protein SAMN02800692_1502 [Luteibacter sp. UNC138MFCol5.1]
MAVGFRARNAANAIQIDQTYRNLALRAKGTLQATTPWQNTWRIATVTLGGNAPVIAWRCNNPCAMVGATRSGNNTTYTFMVAATSGTIEWWLFDEPIYGAVSGRVGLRIRNPTTGVTVFDSRQRYMRIIGSVNGNLTNGFPSGTTTYSGSPAIVSGNMAYFYQSQVVGAPGGPPPYPWIDFVTYPMAVVAGQQVTWSGQMSPAADHPASQPFNNSSRQDAYNYLVVDVANS